MLQNTFRFRGPIVIQRIKNDIKNGQISLENKEKNQEEFQLELNKILKRNSNYKSEDQKSVIENIKKL